MAASAEVDDPKFRLRWVSSIEVLPEAETIAVAILDVEIAASVELIAEIADDIYAPGLELSVQRVGVLDMNVGVPCFAGGIGETVRPHESVFGNWLSMMTMPERWTMQKHGGSPQ